MNEPQKRRLPSLVVDHLGQWCVRHMRLGLVLGASFALLDQLVVPAWGVAALDGAVPDGWQRLAAVAITVASCVMALLLVAVLSAGMLRWKWGRVLALASSTLLVVILCAAHTLGVLVRMLAGSYLTLGAVEFCLNSWEHFLHVAFDGYAGVSSLWFALCAGSGVAALLYARRSFREFGIARSQRWELLLGAGLSLLVVAATQLPHSEAFAAGVNASTPELSLLASFEVSDVLPDDFRSEASELPAPGSGPPLAAGPLWQKAVHARRRPSPNVLLIMLESVGTDHLGYMGYARNVTPNIDRIARRSLRMRRVWTTATHSNYAQMAILSSLFPRRGAGLDVYKRLDYPRVLFHDMLFELGYETATISSQDEGWQGMKRFEDTGTPRTFWHSPDYDGPHIDTGSERVIPDNVTVDKLLSWIDARHNEQQWALYVNLQATHFPYKLPHDAPRPYQPSEPQRGTFTYLGYPESERATVINRYDNALAFVDAQIGRIEEHLESHGLLDDTLIVITSDHGELFHERGLVTHGRTLREHEARVPLLVTWPDHVQPADVDEPVSTLDVLPSIAELIGIPPHPAFQGTSFVSLDDAAARPGVYMNIQGLRTAEALVCWPWKLVLERTGRRVQLFNLEDDPHELKDRVSSDFTIAKSMIDVLSGQMKAQVRYHRFGDGERERRYAPRLSACPATPGVQRKSRFVKSQ